MNLVFAFPFSRGKICTFRFVIQWFATFREWVVLGRTENFEECRLNLLFHLPFIQPLIQIENLKSPIFLFDALFIVKDHGIKRLLVFLRHFALDVLKVLVDGLDE